MEEDSKMEKVGNFVSSTFNKIVNLIIFLIIIGLIIVIGWFWHEGQMDRQEMESLKKENLGFRNEIKRDDDKNLDIKEEDVNVSNKKVDIKEFRSKLVDLTFLYPATIKNFRERDYSSKKSGYNTGKRVDFYDSNESFPEFIAVSSDYLGDDFIEGSLDLANSFKVKQFIGRYTRVVEKADGVYHVTGYYVRDCSSTIKTWLLVRPVNQNLKYIYFFLDKEPFYYGNITYLEDMDKENCLVKDDIIKEKIDYIADGKEPNVNGYINAAMELIKTMK